MSTVGRRRAQRRGHWAEALCVFILMLRGYRILARRMRSPVGEIDILARRGRSLAVVEVKARATLRQAAEAVTPAQQKRLVRAAAWFVAGRPDLAALDIRFDVMLVAPRRLPRHIVDAWRTEPV